MTTYTFTAYKVVYDGDTPASFDLTTFEIVFDETTTPSLIYSELNAPLNELPEVDFVSTNEYDVRVDGISLNTNDFLDGVNDETLFGTVEWNDGTAKAAQVLVLFDSETNTDYIVPLFGADPGLTNLSDFLTFEGQIGGLGPASSPYAEGDSIDISTSTFITATDNNDRIDGTEDSDDFSGGSGNDTIFGNGGNDDLRGDDGNDSIDGGDGSDTIDGGAGDDYLNPGTSLDFDDIRPGSGNDTIDLTGQGTSFAFLYYGNLGSFYTPMTEGIVANLNGSDGLDDTIVKNGTDTDTIIGLDVPLYNDIGIGLFGTELNDTFNLTNMNGFGANGVGAFFEITGGDGVDSYVIDGRAEVRLNFDEDTDFNPATQGLVLNLATGVITNDGFGNAETITYLNDGSLARVRATNNNDDIIGSDADETFGLLGGTDTLDAGGGFDRLRYDQGVVTGLVVDLQAGTATGTIDWRGNVFAFDHDISGIERVDGSRDNGDTISGSGNDEFLRGRGGDDSLTGNGGNDTLQGDDGNDEMFGGAGDDFFRDGSGNDIADGGSGNDTFLMDSGFDNFAGGDGWDRLDYGNASGFANGAFTLRVDLLAGTSFAVEDPTNANDSLSGIEEIAAQDLQIDVIGIGDNVANRFETGFGADSLEGNGGDDTLIGGAGNDTLRGGDGRDNLRGGDGNDLLDASGGTVESNGFGDFVEAGTGANTIIGHAGLWAAGEGIDIFYGDVSGSGGVEITINADGAGTTVSNVGGVVNDTFTFTHFFIGTADNDTITRSANDDRWFGFQGGAGDDTITGNSNGTDYVDYRDDSEFNGGGAVTVDLANQTATDGFGGTDTLIDIEQVRGSVFGDTLTGDSEANELDGDDGNDTLNGGDGSDTLIGAGGNDELNGEAGDDLLLPGSGTDQVNGGSGFDTVAYDDGSLAAGINASLLGGGSPTVWTVSEVGGSTDIVTDVERVIGTGFNDTLNGANATIAIQLFGGGGDDSITGGAGADYFQAGAGNDIINGGTSPADGLDFISYYWDIRNANEFDNANLSTGITVAYTSEFGATVSEDGFGTQDTLLNIGGLEGTQFADNMTGAVGTQFFRGLAGDDVIDGGDGIDWASYRNTTNKGGTQGAVLNFVTNSFIDTYGDTDTLTSIENISGSDFGDVITGNSGVARELNGHGGNDTIIGGNQADTIDGGDGDDSLQGGGGNDTLTGGAGNDFVDGGDGNDTFVGGDGTDTFVGGAGVDLYQDDPAASGFVAQEVTLLFNLSNGQSGLTSQPVLERNSISGIENYTLVGDFDSLVIGDAAGNVFTTDLGDDTINGGLGNDSITSGGGNDDVDGSNGGDTIFGGAGQDIVKGGIGFDLLFGQNDDDTVDGGSANDSLFGGNGNDLLLGGSEADELNGGAGVDTLDGGAGSDIYVADGLDVVTDSGAGDFDRVITLDAAGVNFDLTLWSGIERVNGFSGNDTIDASSYGQVLFVSAEGGDDVVIGSSENDILLGGTGNDNLDGGAGNDLMLGGAGNDTFVGGAGDDAFYVGDSGDVVTDAGDGFDKVVIDNASGVAINVGAWSNLERVSGFTGNDTVDATGNSDGIVVFGGAGLDLLIGGSGADILVGQADADVLIGAAGNDSLVGSTGDDTFEGGDGNDLIIAGAGADTFVFTDGFDTDTIADYDDALDVFDFSGHSAVLSFGDLSVTQAGANTLIELVGGGTDVIVLAGTSALLIDESDFIFV